MAKATRFLVAPDKFKGTFTAGEVARLIGDGIRETGAEAVELPVADGGDGTADALMSALGGAWVEAPSADVLGNPATGRFALVGDGSRAVVELAEVAGLGGTDPDRLDPLAATSRGGGMLIAAAVERGAGEIIFAPGGSASTDGGRGLLEVLEGAGVRPRITVACDVEHAFEQAAPVFAPQKGADPGQVRELEVRLDRLAGSFPRDPRGRIRTGCGGGVSGGLWACLDAELVAGADLVLDAIGFDRILAGCEAVITGEGRLDAQTAGGKAVAVVAARAASAGLPAAAVVGELDLGSQEIDRLGLIRAVEAGTGGTIRDAGHRLALELGGAGR